MHVRRYERSRHCVVTCTKEKSLTIPATGYSLVERTTLTRAYLSQLALVTCLEEGLQQRTGSPSKKPAFVKSRLVDVDKTLNEDKKEEGKSKVDNQKEKWVSRI
uniref:Uncharacterized protein n=1 Tax=Vespula pensylvanica TaxID=30213 RepID=A0A834P7V6_VESPE|nr:hypothetical protein H0235_004592 [Vespula pensylvanica]